MTESERARQDVVDIINSPWVRAGSWGGAFLQSQIGAVQNALSSACDHKSVNYLKGCLSSLLYNYAYWAKRAGANADIPSNCDPMPPAGISEVENYIENLRLERLINREGGEGCMDIEKTMMAFHFAKARIKQGAEIMNVDDLLDLVSRR